MDRKQFGLIRADLDKKMVLLSGPRQVGKSWLAKRLLAEFEHSVYLNFDNGDDRAIIEKSSWPSNARLLVLDELHKMPGWKNYLKGLVDTKPQTLHVLVTGSARLDTFRQGGDSLAGRYFLHRLMPLSPVEILASSGVPDLDRLMNRGGFPEPWLALEDSDATRWRRQYLDGLIREDILSFENVRELKSMGLLVELLRSRVGSPVSYQAISEDLGIAPNTVKRHIEILEALFIIFLVYPHSRDIARAISRQPKVYFMDTGLVKGDKGIVFENLAALSLLKRQMYLEDQDGIPRALRYLRTKEGREVDFLLSKDEEPRLMLEAKYSDSSLAPNLKYFREHYDIPAVQLVADLRQERDDGGIQVRRAVDWLGGLEI